MNGLNTTLSLASQALSADSGALSLTNNNISNVNTPGYSREVVNLSAEALTNAGTTQEDGVAYLGFTSVRDEVLQIGIQAKTADLGSLNAQSTLWNQAQNAFASTTGGISASISNLFSSLSELSTMPSDGGARQSALSAAGNLVDSFHAAAAALTSVQTQADSSVVGVVANINELTNQIAQLDTQLSSAQASGQDGGSIEDERDERTTELAGLLGVTSTTTQTTPSLTTAGSSPLVVDGAAYALQVTKGADGTAHVLDAQGNDITSSITGGTLGGMLTMRDVAIPGVSTTLNSLVSEFASAMNTAQADGYDSDGNQGTAMFSVPNSGNAAATISLALASPSGLALSSDGSAGSSGNLSNLLSVQTNNLPSGQTPTDTYASLVEGVGDSSASISSRATATTSALGQLTSQQATESGVSIDEETTNLLRFQQAYTAAAKVVSTVNDLYSILMNMGVVTS